MAEKKQYISTEPADKIKFRADPKEEQKTFLKITNKSEMKQAFKVKCTRNDLFRIKPATGILDYNQSLTIALIYRGGQDNVPSDEKHHFGVYHIPAPEGCTCEGAWAEHYGPPQGEHKLRVVWE
ncbi:Major sperm protein [Caenorhabditis elegans]|uniref:Major sperm protein n=1 Tax=Caenorhabditis elegans TaxID=6239 RepID=Q7YX19_CAEEL|nr:Major sperm protein [Caenorhabditis elegans]CAE17819.1 Major sperm protein [Caenorhabditis elegans]|eukprot:NP_001021485.1 Major sperm protein [Caenorhabditis elegans]